MRFRPGFLILIGGLLLAGCGNDTKPPVNHAVVAAPVLTEPFRFHKLVEVSPGQYYDVLSWGRASKDTGAFVILHSDSSGRKYSTTTGDLYGAIVDVYNTDMDMDGNPELLIQVKKKDTINYTTIYAFEFVDSKAQKLDFPKLSDAQHRGYRGQDNFYIEEGSLIREFPIYKGIGSAATPTGQKRKLEYGMSNNTITVKQLSKDSVGAAPEPVTPPQKQTPAKKGGDTKKKHHEPEKHKAAKKRKHHNDDQ